MRNKVFEIVAGAIEELNEELEYDSLRAISPETPIFGGEFGIDSLSLVSLVAGLERELAEVIGRQLILVDDKALSMRNSPFRTVGAVVEFIMERLEDLGVDDG